MGRRKNQNNQSSNPAQQPTKSRSTENGAAGGNANESSNVDEILCDAEESANSQPVEESFPDGDDKTSADYYFDSCSHFVIHEEMLKDVVRTQTYKNIIYQNKFLFKDKVVLDVGAGTGILSQFCAKAGAKHIYAIECSHMADMAKEIVVANGFSKVWNSVYGFNMSCIKKQAIVEPLVDTVNQNQIVTDCQLLKLLSSLWQNKMTTSMHLWHTWCFIYEMPQVDRLLHRALLKDNALEIDGPVFGGCDNNM